MDKARKCSFTQADLDEIFALATGNPKWKQKDIAAKFGCGIAKINYHLNKMKGAKKKPEKDLGPPTIDVKCRCPFCSHVYTYNTNEYTGKGVWWRYCDVTAGDKTCVGNGRAKRKYTYNPHIQGSKHAA